MVESSLGKTEVNYTMARFFSVYGPLGRSDMAYQRAIDCALKEQPFQLNGDGSQQRDFTFVEDVVTVLEQTLLSEKESGPMNIGGGSPRSISELLNIVERKTGKKIQISRAGSVGSTEKELSITKASTALSESRGFTRPQTSLEDGIEKTIKTNEFLGEKHAPYL